MVIETKSKILSLPQFLPTRERFKEKGKTLVLTNGCFDLLHLGHIRYLAQAKALGDILVVGLNSDSSTRKIKGPERPIIPEDERAQLVAALVFVDYVIIFSETTAQGLVTALKPEIYVKGGDYSREGKALPEAPEVATYGGRVVILPYTEGLSSSTIIHKIRERYGPLPKVTGSGSLP
ncbi:MAG: D-glycero-beta-D-manno-heptose 1-phosphate adenylyltransferase [Chloroflexi bacterium]|nr:D-glycero-beta-D-manno-heptose 1-phosphate adenylyltransferase [Chloroflexota bacterium]